MTRYVALLRGANVNGITLRMADLAEVFTGLGLDNVKTVLASGNVLFDADDDGPELKGSIEKALRTRFGYEAWVQVLTTERVARIVADYPFETDESVHHPYVVFCVDEATRDELAGAAAKAATAVERVAAGEGVLYGEAPRGGSTDTPLAKVSARTRYKASTTTRNVRTLKRFN